MTSFADNPTLLFLNRECQFQARGKGYQNSFDSQEEKGVIIANITRKSASLVRENSKEL